MPDLAECPSCGRKTLVTRNADLYQCILCDFKRDLSNVEKRSPNTEMPWLLVIVFFILMVFLFDASLPSSRPTGPHEAPGYNAIYGDRPY